MASLSASQVFPQLPNEPDAVYGARTLFNQIPIGVANLGGQIGGAVDMALDTPAARARRAAEAAKRAAPQQPASDVFANGGGSPIENLTERLINRGLPGHIARGVAAGILAESNGNPNAFNPAGGGQGAFGLSQWRGSRQQALKATYGNNPTDDQQLDFLVKELKGGDPGGPAVLASKTPDEAFQNFVTGFLRPGSGTQGDMLRGYQAMGYKDANQRAQLSAPYVNPFDPSYAQQAIGQLSTAQQAAKTPFSVEGNAGPMPEVPAPEPTPKTDFSASDAALQALRPVEMTLKEQHDVKWKNFWAGLGKAMASTPQGAGIGDFFLRLGGGALMGKAAGMEEIQAKKDEYDTKLARFQAAVYEHDFQKAQIAHQELLQDWQANRQWALEKYQQGLEVWKQNATPQIVGNDIVFTKRTPDGKVSVQGIPINSMVDAEYAGKKAAVLLNMFGEQNSANAQVTGVENQIQGQIATAKAGAVLMGSGASDQEKAAAAAYAPVQAASYAVDSGMVDSVLGPDETEKLTKSVQTTLTSRGLFMGTPDYAEAFSKMMTQQLAMAAFSNPQLMSKLTQLSPAASLFQNYADMQKSKSTTQQTVDSRGRVTNRTTTTAPSGGANMSPLDVFAQQIQPDNSQPYAAYGYVRR